MSSVCLACLGPLETETDGRRYHAKCAKALFGATTIPAIDIDLAHLHTVALAMVGKTTLSGIQRKISLGFATGARHLQVAAAKSLFILKPQSPTFPSLPENEHVTMRMAERAGIAIPPCALVALTDGSLAYVVKRFDRTDDGRKLAQEDFCQLAVKPPKDKYEASAELCAKLVLRHASAPIVEAQRLFRLVAFAWWTGNGDMHLKNFSLLRGEDGAYRLSPAYDLLCTRLVIADDLLALPIGGNKKNVTRRQWLAFAGHCKLPVRAAERVLGDLSAALPDLLVLVERSALPAAMKDAYAKLLRVRAKSFAAG